MKKRYVFAFFFFLFTSLFDMGCKKAVNFKKKKPNSRKSNKSSTGAIKPFTAITGAAGIFLVTKEHMTNTFQAGVKKPPIYSSFMNNGSSDININISLDGETWESKEIEQGDKIKLTSGGAGVIGIESENNYYQVEKSDDFLVKEKDGSLTFYSH